jgi:hypothetical protein
MRFEIVRRIVEGQEFRAERFLLDPTIILKGHPKRAVGRAGARAHVDGARDMGALTPS